MKNMRLIRLAPLCVALILQGCGSSGPSEAVVQSKASQAIYRIGPLDSLEIFIWRMPELSRTVTVRPDGRISVPLIDDLVATGKTPTQLARDIEVQLTKYVQDPTVTVIVGGFHGPFDQQARTSIKAVNPSAIPTGQSVLVLM